MFGSRYKLSYDERRIIVLCLIEMKNKLIRENRYTDAIDDLMVKFMDQLSFRTEDEYMTLHNPVRGYFLSGRAGERMNHDCDKGNNESYCYGIGRKRVS